MPRYFTLEQAQRLLPEVQTLLKEAMTARASVARAEREIENWTNRVQVMGGVRLDPDKMSQLAKERENGAQSLNRAVGAVVDLGVQIKDLEIGLLDFPTLYQGREVLLCWRLGESGIGYWHSLEEGFRGRKQIDRDFIDQHQGDERD